MMALAKCISHTSESMGYGWNEKEKNATVISQKHMIANSPKEATEMFKLVQSTNSNCDKNTISVVLSRSKKAINHFTKKEWKQYIKDFIEEMNLEEHQHIGFRHFDKNHDHVHLYINRINFKGEAYKDSFIGSECGIAADRLNIKYGIERPKQIKKDREEKLKSDHRDIRASIYKHHCFVLDKIKPSSYSEYVSAFAKADIKVLAVTSKNGHLNGFRYEKNGISFKASQVHRSMSLVNLNKSLFPFIDGDDFKKQKFLSDDGSYGLQAEQKEITSKIDHYTDSFNPSDIDQKIKKNTQNTESEKYGAEQNIVDKEKSSKMNHKAVRDFIYKHHKYVISTIKPKQYSEYISAFAKANIKVLAITSKNGHLNGFRYEKDGLSFKASEVHRSMSLTNLNDALFPTMKQIEFKTQIFPSSNGKYGPQADQKEIVSKMDTYTDSFITNEVFIPSGIVENLQPDVDYEDNEKKKKKKRRGKSM